MKHKICTIALLMLLCGCSVFDRSHIPQDEYLNRLVTHEVRQFKGKYILNVYDCSNMSYDLANRLNAQGIRADIFAYDFGVTGHAVVKITYKGKEYYSDPGRQWPFIRPPEGELYWQGAPCDLPENYNEEFKGHLK